MQLNDDEWSLFNLQKKVRQIGEKKFYEVYLKKADEEEESKFPVELELV